jgi:murein hydrolase activator
LIFRAGLLALCLATPVAAQTVAEAAVAAAADMQAAIAALDKATTAKDRIAALTATIRAYEAGLATLREALRQARLRETQLTLRFESERGRLSQLLGVLAQVDPDPGPLLLLHPAGPVGTVRSGMILAEIAPALQAEAEKLRSELTELRDLRILQESAAATLAGGLGRAQVARSALSQAISDRTDLPKRFDEDPAAMQALIDSSETLDAFAAGLAPDTGGTADFADRKGTLPLPVQGTLLRRADEADAAGVRRPGVTIATRPQALVTAPHPGTIRYRGPLLDYGNVMILEPGGDYLLVLAGLETVYGEVGEVVAEGAPLGLMGGAETTDGAAEFLVAPDAGGAVRETETLYMELRRGTVPEDPAPWFAALGE